MFKNTSSIEVLYERLEEIANHRVMSPQKRAEIVRTTPFLKKIIKHFKKIDKIISSYDRTICPRSLDLHYIYLILCSKNFL